MKSAADGGRLRRGAALIEIVIGVLLIAMAVSAMMGALVSTSLQSAPSGVNEGREQAAVCLSQLLQELKNYVTADTSPSPDAPNGNNAAGWTIPGDSCPNSCWALDPAFNPHDVSSRLPAQLTQAGAKMTYTVTVVAVNGLSTSQVNATITWNPISQ